MKKQLKQEQLKLDTLLLFPPPYVYSEAQPGIAAISGFALSKNIRLEIVDANISGLEFILRSADIQRANQALDILKSAAFYKPEEFETFRKAKEIIEDLSREFSSKHKETLILRRNTVLYLPKYDATRRAGILQAIKSPQDNIFYEFFNTELLPMLMQKWQEQKYTSLGIGITDRKQAIPGFIIASMLKKIIPDVRIIIGGNYISRGREALIEDDPINRELFNHFDYALFLESDHSFSELVKAVSSGNETAARNYIQKLIWKENREIKHNGLKEITDVKKIPTPNFTGLKAWTPELAIAYNFQRGCNYGICGFCGLMDGYDSFSMRSTEKPDMFVPRRKDIEQVILDLKKLRASGYRYINFTDETFFAADMKRVSEKILEEKLDLKWTCYSRIESKFKDSEFCALISKAGCEFIQFGVESASVKSLELMNKGTQSVDVYQVLKNTHNAGIMNHVFVLVGYPGETIEDALSLFPFLEEVKDYTFTIKPTWFKLSRGSPDSYTAESKGLERTFTEGDLAPNLHFNKNSGMGKKASQAVNDLIDSWLRRNHAVNYVAGTYCYSQRFFIGY